jgi:GMP synthase-like glutamine amidotransferase
MFTVIQNDPEVPLGAFAGYLDEAGIRYSTIHPCRGEELPPIEELTAVIVLGGAMGVHDTERHPFLTVLKDFIRGCVAHDIPFLGICLGGQLLADALGGEVISGSPFGEKGTLSVRLTAAGVADPLFAGVPEEFVTFQWHNDSFIIPVGAFRLAESAACPNQAFRYGENAWGTQFHPEVDRAIVDCWVRWSEETAPSVDDYLTAFAAGEEAYRSASRRMLRNFVALSGLQENASV